MNLGCSINQASRLIPRKHDNDTCDGPENSSDKEHAATKAKGVKSALPGALVSFNYLFQFT